MTGHALVLAGGGLAGIAWETGMLAGVAEVWPDFLAVLDAPETAFVGTSAGSVVASQVASGVPLIDLYDQQLAPESAEIGADFDATAFAAMIAGLVADATSPADARRRVGTMALGVDRRSAAARREAVFARLTRTEWPARDLQLTAVDAESGDLRVFRAADGVALVDAIGASCAVPGVWPVVEIEGRRFMDGGVRSGSNADLAPGDARTLVLSPASGTDDQVIPPSELSGLAASQVVYADAGALAAFGANPLDPGVRPGAARAGRAQGRVIAATIAAFWS